MASGILRASVNPARPAHRNYNTGEATSRLFEAENWLYPGSDGLDFGHSLAEEILGFLHGAEAKHVLETLAKD
ncbi:hypothetical protein E4U54_003086 [Claviceps lovelessii]|nr:hypothetical protein E4U54_003086 [Claviceps lovelessii]